MAKKTSIDIFWVEEEKMNTRLISDTIRFTVDNYKDQFPTIDEDCLNKFEEDFYIFFKNADIESDAYVDDHFKVYYIKNGVAGDVNFGKYLLSIKIYN